MDSKIAEIYFIINSNEDYLLYLNKLLHNNKYENYK